MTALPNIFIGSRRRLLLRLTTNGIMQALMIIFSMLLVRHAFNVLLNPEYDDPEIHLFETTEVWQIVLFAIGLLGCTGFAAWLRYVERVDAERLGQEYVHRIRIKIFDRMKFFSHRSLANRSTGASTLRFVGDLSAIRRWVSLGLARIVVSGITTLISMSVLAYIDLYLAVCAIIILMLGLAWNLKLGPRMHRVVSESRRLRGTLAGNITEKIRSIIVIQAFNQTDRERYRFKKQSWQLRDAMIGRARASAAMRVVNDGATALSMAAILSFGALEVFYNKTSSGNVVAAMAVVGFLSTAFRDLGRVHEYFQSYKVSKQKILDFMQTRALKARSPSRPDLKVERGEIELKKVSLKGSLNRVTATIRAGSRLAIIGDNGAGKSSLLQVVSRLIDPSAGKILIDGQDIGTCNLSSVRRAVSIVSPDLPLLKGSVRFNLLYRNPAASAEEQQQVRELCDIDALLAALPEGERFVVREGGRNLSLGQRHKLAIARALLGQPSILIIDEIDANLDAQAVKILGQVIRTFPGTVLMVSRSEHCLALADCYWLLSDGELVNVKHKSESTVNSVDAAELAVQGGSS